MTSTSADLSSRDRGETSAEAVLVLPVLILLVMVVLQSALYFHTAHVARAAAAEGAVAAASSVTNTGAERAAFFATEAGGRIEGAPSAEFSDGLVRVRVTLRVPSLVPFLATRVTRDATEPKERIVAEIER